MTREQIIKSLQLCSNEVLDICTSCPYWRHEYCRNDMVQDALALIRELIEENERLKMEFHALDVECCRLERLEDEYHFSRPKAIQKMAERLKKRFPAIDPCIFDNIAEEVLEE